MSENNVGREQLGKVEWDQPSAQGYFHGKVGCIIFEHILCGIFKVESVPEAYPALEKRMEPWKIKAEKAKPRYLTWLHGKLQENPSATLGTMVETFQDGPQYSP